MRFKWIYIFMLLISIQLSAQVDSENKSIRIPAEETKDKDSSSALEIKPEKTLPSLSKSSNKTTTLPYESKVKLKEHKEEFSMIDNSNLMNPGSIYEERWKKRMQDQKIVRESMEDQFLGDYVSNGKFVKIICRDHEYPDGDRVRVIVNDDIIVPSMTLTSGYKAFDVDLVKGFNKIEFLALNQGQSGPNTAEFIVYDDQGNLVSSKQWNLLTGVKAIIIVTKETD